MSDLLNNLTDYEVEKYIEAENIIKSGINAQSTKNKKSVFNPETGTHDILTQMASGGYVKIGEESLDLEATRPGSILLNGKEYGRETPEYQRYYPDPEPQPNVMSTSPSMGAIAQTEETPFVSMQTRIEDAKAYANSLGNPTAQDLLAAGYTPDVINAVMGNTAQDNMPNQVARTEPLSTEEVENVIRSGGSVMGEYDPTLRETGKVQLSEYLLGLAEGSLEEELRAQGLTEDQINTQLEAEMPRLKNEATVLSDMFFGSPNSLGIGVGDFVTAGIMDIQEGARLFKQGRTTGGADRGLGALLVLAGLAEATGVGKLISKPLKKVIEKTRAGLADVGERLNQPGQMPTLGSNFGNIGQNNKRSFYVNARAGGAENENAKQQVLSISQGNKPKIENLASYFEQNHKNIYGRQLDPNEDLDFDLALNAAADEVVYQLDQAVSGKGWYDADVKKTFETLSKIPGLEVLQDNETMRVLWSALAAPTSIGNKVSNNTRAATAAFLQYLKTGKVPVNPPQKGAVTEGISGAGWGMKQKSVASGMRVIAHLVETKGLEGFADWWLSPHTLQELTEIRKAAGLSSGPAGLGGGKDSIHLGAMVLGDKTGRYSLNINGYQGTTKDVWFARSYNRHFGNMFNADGTVAAQPRNLLERRRMEEFTARLVDKLSSKGLSEQDAQAVLWFYEQNLFTDLGVLSRPGSFSEAAEKIGNDLRSGVRSSDENQIGAQSTDAELTDFRSISAPKRTVRSQRRNREIDGEASSPYTRGSGEGSDGDGLLVLNPNEQTQQIYDAAGISLPKINETQAARTATQYNADMTNAMSGHTFGAQVEIKSPEELASARLFRTENGSGFAIKPDGDIVAVFQSGNETGSVGYSMMQAAIAAGGKKLDAFDTFLSGIYETAGFKPVARLPWNDKFAPDNWDKNTFKGFNNGEPDVVFYVYDSNYFGGTTNVPKFTNYDQAVAAQDAELARLSKTNN